MLWENTFKGALHLNKKQSWATESLLENSAQEMENSTISGT